jgi:tRNA dimethylallyltransferase
VTPKRPAVGPLIVIGGPTATGKTALSIRLALALGDSEIVSADSRQVYQGMDIGTAKPARSERNAVPHHGLDLVRPDERFSVSGYARHATDALAAIHGRAHRAFLVGGTGLYLRAVARGLDVEDSPSDPSLRAELEREQVRAGGVEAQVERLSALAPRLAARTDLRNPRRVVRALEIATLAGDRLPPPPRGYPAPVLWIGLRLPPDVHRQRIANRAASQFAGGLVREAQRLQKRYPRNAAAFTAFGYWEAFAVLDGALSREEAIDQTIARTRDYARRQLTWFRAEEGLHWVDAADDPLPSVLQLVREFEGVR